LEKGRDGKADSGMFVTPWALTHPGWAEGRYMFSGPVGKKVIRATFWEKKAYEHPESAPSFFGKKEKVVDMLNHPRGATLA